MGFRAGNYSIARVFKRSGDSVISACLVSNRVGLGGAKFASFTRGTASREPFLHGSFFGFRSVSTKGPSDGSSAYARERQNLTLTVTKQALTSNFRESSKGEVRRISLPRTRMNKGKGKGRGCNYSLSPAFTYR